MVLTPEQIEEGIRLLGEILSSHDGPLAGGSEPSRPEAVPLV